MGNDIMDGPDDFDAEHSVKIVMELHDAKRREMEDPVEMYNFASFEKSIINQF